MNLKLIRNFSLMLLLVVFSAAVFAKGGGDKKPAPTNALADSVSWTHFNINNISTWFQNTGYSDINQNGNSGLVFPKGSNRTAAFQSGFLWGGKVDGQIRVGGAAYRTGTVPGRILPNGTAENPKAPDVRIYRVRRDYADVNADFSSEIADGDGTDAADVRKRYDTDWKAWPASQGAPYEDVNGDGKYDPNIDIPGVPGSDQTVWFVANDLDASQTDYLYGSLPMGIEEQVTVWGYNTTGALGNMFFRKYTIINKNLDQKPFTEMFVSMWSDVDLGDAGDDYVGCDTTLSLMYFYNAKAVDAQYSPLPPPATGFDFFQGPIVPAGAGDQAIYKGKYKTGYKNLPMTGFYFFINPDPVYRDPAQGDYTKGTLGFWNLFHGKVSSTGADFTDPHTGARTMYPLAGDPVAGTGWIDGQLHPPGDRRGGMTSGPFDMAYGDTQEVVVSEMCAGAVPGIDRLGAIQLLKFYDLQAQLAYNNFFNVPSAPPAPALVASAFDQSIVLTWGSDPTQVAKTETFSKLGYAFQGYNVYQLPTATAQASEAKLLATYDLVDGVGKIIDKQFDPVGGVVTDKVVEFGADTGIKRVFEFNRDLFKGGAPILNGTKYFLAVTSYAYNSNPSAVPKALENPMSSAVMTVVPQKPNPGVRYNGAYGDKLTVNHSAGSSDGIVTPLVVDPSKVTGSEYSVTFALQGTKKVWNLLKGSATILSGQTHFGSDDSFLIVDGIQVGVQDAPPQIKGPGEGDGMVEVAYGGTVLPPGKYDAAGAPYKGNKVWHSLNSPGGDRYYVSAGNNGAISSLYRYVTYASPHDFEFRFTAAGGYGVYAFTDDKIAKVPFELWDIGIGTPDDPKDDRRMIPLILENVATADTWGWATGSDPYFGYPQSDWVYWMDAKDKTLGDKGYKQFENTCIQSGGAGATYNYAFDTDPTAGDYNADFHGGFVYPIGRFVVCDFDQDGKMPPAGTTIRINYTKPITTSDVYKFTAPSVVNDPNLAKTDVQSINVFPNPYYGVNSQEINKYQRFVTFSHLPNTATIRIFNLAGQLVRTLQKNTPDQFFRWDLQNDSSLPVASGLYIVYIDMPDLGTTKILKVAVVQEQQVLDKF